ncbi:MAG: hypothetical protein KY466_06700 [Gemmatimonadetes bacterium]|nr:hypothetical protein [Gemmatimonadota bacterium]
MTRLASCCVVMALAGCGGEPPAELGGFALGMSQAAAAEAARSYGTFTCRYRGVRPPSMTCEGTIREGVVRVVVVDDVTRSITLRRAAGGADPQRAMQRFVDGFGDPAWRERPVPPRARTVEGYHTLWVSEDSTRALATVCAGTELRPPCTVELTTTSPAGVVAKLDTLLGLRR